MDRYLNDSIMTPDFPVFHGSFKSPLGWIYISAYKTNITKISFVKPVKDQENPNELTEAAIKQLEEYFDGKRKEFDLPLEPVPVGTPFQQHVWSDLQEIPYDSTQSYEMIAEKINDPDVALAVRDAVNQNRIAIVIPAHRVVGDSGTLDIFAARRDKKQWLLDHEKSNHN